MEQIFNNLFLFLEKSLLFAVISSFVWGLFSVILSPCHLSSLPLVVGVISNKEITLKKSFLISLIFSLGNLVVIALIGFITSLLGKVMGDTGIIGNILIAVLLFIMGLYLLDIVKLNFLNRIFSQPDFNKKNFFTAFIMGLFFGVGLGPCTFAYLAPIIGIVFAASSSNIIKSILILSFFAIGHSLVLVFFGTFTKLVEKYLKLNEKSGILNIIKKICGILLICGSIYFIIDLINKI
ncbi:MAG: sulfite exporter TauE/SafE family protein [Spirochaetes bacterium]|nr:sulfite exporter TauE/SafE family protein [Spirochaetota bacterium]